MSIFLGCNDLHACTYSDYADKLDRLTANIDIMIVSIREYDSKIKIIINLPIRGGSQYSWGLSKACSGSAKMYNYIIAHTCMRILELYDKADDKIYISPMLMTIDPIYGYKNEYRKVNIYSEQSEFVNCDGIHPNPVGYKQMGDALAGVLAKLCSKQL